MTLSSRFLLSLIAAGLTAASLAGCGDGGGGSNQPVKQPDPDPPAPTSSITDSGVLNTLSYGLWNEPGVSIPGQGGRHLEADILSQNDEVNPNYVGRSFNTDSNRRLDLTYQSDNGFVGIYVHEGETGKIKSDVSIDLTINSTGVYVSNFGVGIKNPIVIEGQNLGSLNGLANNARLNSQGAFRDNKDLGVFSDVLYSSGFIEGAFSNIDTRQGNPRLVAGEVVVRYGDYDNEAKNSLVGIFAADVDE